MTATEKLLDEIEQNAEAEGLALYYIVMRVTRGNVEKLVSRVWGLMPEGQVPAKEEDFIIHVKTGLKLGRTRDTKDYKQLYKLAEYLRNI